MPVYLIRHAHAGSRSGWGGEDRDRPLSEKGWAQATAITERLRGEPIGRVLSSPAVRCVQTVEPLAEGAGLPIEARSEFFEGADGDDAVRLALAHAEENPAVSSHGDVIPKMLRRLAAMGMRAKDGAISQKGSLWVIEIDDGTPTRGRYYPPA